MSTFTRHSSLLLLRKFYQNNCLANAFNATTVIFPQESENFFLYPFSSAVLIELFPRQFFLLRMNLILKTPLYPMGQNFQAPKLTRRRLYS